MSSSRYEVADSEDEDETFLANSPLKTSQATSDQRKAKSGSNHALSTSTSDVNVDKPTESTAQLLNSAFRGLAEVMTDSPASASASAKRRSTMLDESHKTPCVERKAKRVKTDSGKHTTSRIADTTLFEQPRDGASPQTLSSGTGRFDATFKEHEPHVMFPDTGSTAAEHESSLPTAHRTTHDGERTSETSAQKESSSFPWPKSLTQNEDPNTNLEAGSVPDQKQDGSIDASTFAVGQVAEEQDKSSRPTLCTEGAATAGDMEFGCGIFVEHKGAQQRQRSSPVIEIEFRKHTVAATALEGLTEPTKSRKRKSSSRADGEIPSDDFGGMPKEQYKPRPTSRRATQISDVSIDYGEIPEKAVKKRAKRSKTAGDDTPSAHVEQLPKDVLGSTLLEPSPNVKDSNQMQSIEDAARTASATAAVQTPDDAPKGMNNHEPTTGSKATKARKTAQSCPQADAEPIVPEAKASDKSPLKSTQERKTDKDGFAIPMSISKPSIKARRHHTTIFEDLTDFNAAQKSPSLNQQQANRKKQALKEVENKAGRKSKKRVLSVADSEDEEDELSRVSEDENAEPQETVEEVAVPEPPKKRGRGRPKKTVTPAAKASDPVPLDLAAEEEQVGPTAASKVFVESETNAASQNATPAPEQEPENATTTAARKDDVNPPRATPPKITNNEGSEESAASKKAESAKSTPEVTHSPIKSLAGMKYRVGLSKRQRIPSLLRTRNPIKARNAA